MESPVEGGDVLDLGLVEGSTRALGSTYYLVGKLCTSKPFNVFALMDVMVKAFKTRNKAVVREWAQNMLIFTFTDARDWVVRNQPWHFDGQLFAVKPLLGSEQPSTVTVSKGSFWVRAHDIPIMCQTEAALISIAHWVGEFEVFEPPDGSNVSSYLRFKVSMDITKPLLRGMTLRFNGDDIWVPISYESLPFYCFCCGMIGHSFKFCDSYDLNECPSLADMDFGPSLRAEPLKKGRGPRIEIKTYVQEGGVRSGQLVREAAGRTQTLSQDGSGNSVGRDGPLLVSKGVSVPGSRPFIHELASIQKSNFSGSNASLGSSGITDQLGGSGLGIGDRE
ncbi:hypothetical protein ACS0TY_035461 [Phlomoides rotata]